MWCFLPHPDYWQIKQVGLKVSEIQFQLIRKLTAEALIITFYQVPTANVDCEGKVGRAVELNCRPTSYYTAWRCMKDVGLLNS